MDAGPEPDLEVVVIQEPDGQWTGRLQLPDGRVIYGTEKYLTGEIARAAMMEMAKGGHPPEDDIGAQAAEVAQELRRQRRT